MQKYNHQKIEKKWQGYWQKKKIFLAKDFSKKPKKYVLVEFPYPSGEGLHMGHLRPYTAGDVYSRYLRLKGYEVMYPVGWDAFGLPAENYAIKNKVHPSVSTTKNIKNAKKQLQAWGMSFDWSREINTTDPEYYKWTQWIFVQFFKKGLAYESTGVINWCPKDKTGLANEEVIEGRCERCGTKVEKKELRQWYLRITAYAEKLLEGLKSLNKWPEAIKLQQENWIGKSVGAEMEFDVVVNKAKQSQTNYLILHCRQGSSTTDFYQNVKKHLETRGFRVQIPNLPNTQEPNDNEQVDYVLKNCQINENTIIIGHSFGGVVALRLLERGIKVNSVILVSVPFSGKFLDGKTRQSVVDALKKGFDFKQIKMNAKSFLLLYDISDYVVPISDGEIFAKKLDVNLIQAKGQKPHFSSSEEPEVLNLCAPSLKVFTTRPDTIFGATYMVVAPEHSLIRNFQFQISNFKEVEEYIKKAKNKSDIDRTAEGKEKTGVELEGIKAVNPATKQEIPIWVADYVLGEYGTGAIMAVPAHDERDFEFAKKYKLPIKRVVQPNVIGPVVYINPDSKLDISQVLSEKQKRLEVLEEIYSGVDGKMIDSGKFTGMYCTEAIPKMAQEFGKLAVQYKLRDWVFSRQRYWGEPIPLIHCEDCGIVPVPDKDLPVKLPKLEKYEPTGTGESPLTDVKSWLEVKCPKCNKLAWRETNTMPNWAGSSWYWLRYADPNNKEQFASKKKLKYWQPVDVYFGGMEHTTLHLLYSRFWNLFLYDQGLVTEKEPYALRKPHGIILAADGEKMSKSRGNVVNPDDICKKYGADTLRMYELFLGPHDLAVSWNDQGVIGVRRFLERIWQWANKKFKNNPPAGGQNLKISDKVERALHRLTKKITEDIENYRFNTAVSAFMEFHNEIKDEPVTKGYIKTVLILLYPFAPHLAEELYQILGGKRSLQFEKWPGYNPTLVIDKIVEVVIQINGKVRGKIQVPFDSNEDQVKAKSLELEVIKKALVQESIKRVVFVPNKLINLVI